MSTISLPLDQVRIANSNDGFELSLDSSLLLESSEESSTQITCTQLLDLLYSGKAWVSRGPGYKLDFTILHNGEQLHGLDNKKIIEGIAQHLQDAPVS